MIALRRRLLDILTLQFNSTQPLSAACLALAVQRAWASLLLLQLACMPHHLIDCLWDAVPDSGTTGVTTLPSNHSTVCLQWYKGALQQTVDTCRSMHLADHELLCLYGLLLEEPTYHLPNEQPNVINGTGSTWWPFQLLSSDRLSELVVNAHSLRAMPDTVVWRVFFSGISSSTSSKTTSNGFHHVTCADDVGRLLAASLFLPVFASDS